MECVHPDTVRLGTNEAVYPVPHFLGRLIREGDGQDLSRTDAELQHMGNAAGQGLRLSGPGAGHNEHRPFYLLHRFQLAVI